MDARENTATLIRLVNGYYVSQAIHVAAKLGIADLLVDGPRRATTSPTARAPTPAALPSAARAGDVGVFHEEDDRRFSLTPVGELFRSDAPGSLPAGRPMSADRTSGRHGATSSTASGPARTPSGMSRPGHLELPGRPARGGRDLRRGDERAHRRFECRAPRRVRLRPLRNARRCRRRERRAARERSRRESGAAGSPLRPGARRRGRGPVLEAAGVADRCRIDSGNFFEAVPEGGDAYLLKCIIHDWEDEDSIAILRVCRRDVGGCGPARRRARPRPAQRGCSGRSSPT